MEEHLLRLRLQWKLAGGFTSRRGNQAGDSIILSTE